MGRDTPPADVQITRAFIAVVLGLALAVWLMRPLCDYPSARALLPELRVLSGIPSLVI